ncbi:hypothetical protein CI102_10394 [Trichoderma harzianum]|nr:hypothetical protein CI102_10394 [Trichoderma harzianum]
MCRILVKSSFARGPVCKHVPLKVINNKIIQVFYKTHPTHVLIRKRQQQQFSKYTKYILSLSITKSNQIFHPSHILIRLSHTHTLPSPPSSRPQTKRGLEQKSSPDPSRSSFSAAPLFSFSPRRLLLSICWLALLLPPHVPNRGRTCTYDCMHTYMHTYMQSTYARSALTHTHYESIQCSCNSSRYVIAPCGTCTFIYI